MNPSKRIALSNLEKQRICKIVQKAGPKVKQDELINLVSKDLGKLVHRTTLSKILKLYAVWLNEDGVAEIESYKRRPVKWKDLEDALFLWFNQKRAQNALLTDVLLLEKAKGLSERLMLTDFHASNGWLTRFKQKHNIRMLCTHGEGSDASIEGAIIGRQGMSKIINEGCYNPCDVFNFDETGLFFRQKPQRTLATRVVSGQKKCKERITLGLCCNSDGSERWLPVVITTAKRPRSFGRVWEPHSMCHYCHNPKAWMNGSVFQDWIKKVNQKMRQQGRKILLCMDNASSHTCPGEETIVHGLKTIKLTNVTIVFLPANTTSRVQPLDSGIIAAFKCRYKVQLLRWYLEQYNLPENMNVNLLKIMPCVKQASFELSAVLENRTLSSFEPLV